MAAFAGDKGKEDDMTTLTRRSVIRNSLAVAAAGTLARPFIANAAAKTATVWWTQGFVPEEDAAFRKMVEDYQKQSGNTIDYSLDPVRAADAEDRLGDHQRRCA